MCGVELSYSLVYFQSIYRVFQFCVGDQSDYPSVFDCTLNCHIVLYCIHSNQKKILVYVYGGEVCTFLTVQFLEVCRLYWTFILLGIALCLQVPLCLRSSSCCIDILKKISLHPSLYLLVSWAWWDWPLTWLTDHRPSVLWHCWLGHLTCRIVPKMTYNVLSGELNPTIPYHWQCMLLSKVHWCDTFMYWTKIYVLLIARHLAVWVNVLVCLCVFWCWQSSVWWLVWLLLYVHRGVTWSCI